jgi:hypothetical protein
MSKVQSVAYIEYYLNLRVISCKLGSEFQLVKNSTTVDRRI